MSITDQKEVERVRADFLWKRLGLTEPDGELDRAIMAVADKMKGDRRRNRVTGHYLLAEGFGKQSSLA